MSSAQTATLNHDTQTIKPVNDAGDTFQLSERQREKMKADISDENGHFEHSISNKVDMYLASLRAGGIEPVLEDLESCRPPDRPPSKDRNYPAAYGEIMDRLCRTFSKAQLKNFCIQYGIERKLTGKKQTKVGYAEWVITKQWGWDNLREVERRRRDRTEVSSKKFIVSPHELFLLLGKDGSDLLQLSTEYKVHIAVDSQPLSIKVEGLRGSLKTIEAIIAYKRKGILQETVQLPLTSPMTSNSLQRVSRLANAFIENVGLHGKVLIYANNKHRLETAKRIVFRAAERILQRPDVKLLASHEGAQQPSAQASSNMLAMYPFPSQSADSRGADPMFRCRSVRDWLSHTLAEKEKGSVLGSVDNTNPIFINELGTSVTIEKLIHDSSFELEGSPVVKAVTGHVLFSGGDPAGKATLLPPLPGRWPVNRFLQWSEENIQRRQFERCLPSSLLNSIPSSQSFLHRLTYKCRPDDSAQGRRSFKVINFEIGLEEQQNRVLDEEPSTDADSPWIRDSSSSELSQDDPTQQTTVLCAKGMVSVNMGSETHYMLALPERPMDVQISIINTYEPKGAITQLDEYFKEFDAFLQDRSSAQPLAPLSLEVDGSTYTLESRASVRRSIENVVSKSSTLSFTGNETLSTHPPPPSVVRTVTESTFDLDTNHTTLTCELTCDNPSSDEEWNTFLGSVNAMTSSAYEPISIKSSQELIGE